MNQLKPVYINVIDPINPAIERVKTILFRPFDLKKWFVIGFCAWLSLLGSGGGGGGRVDYRYQQRVDNVQQALNEAKVFVLDNLYWIIPLAVLSVVVGIIFWLVLTWLSSRGRFMFLHCVAQNKAEVKIPWAKFRQHADSLFVFRIVLGLIGFFAVLLPILLIIGCVVMIAVGDGLTVFGILGLVIICLVLITVGIILALISKFTKDFVVPIMFLRTTSCRAAWREFLQILSMNKGRFIVYILFQFVIGLAIGAIIITGACLTCCCACCVLAIPYIGTVLMLPLLVFKRAYSLYYLRQYGPEFDVFVTEAEMITTG
jgi:hypothetical protein